VAARSLIIASGVQKRHLGIPGEKEPAGRGVVYCSTCDGPLLNGLDIAVVGGGDSALEAALEMDGTAGKVHLEARSGLTGDQVLEDKIATASDIDVLPHHEPVEITGADAVESRTGVRGVFSAGDCTDTHDKQIVISVGEGAKAALAAFEYLVAQV
jgi:alkyl hydroperoxide reductase subunit F